MDDDDYRFYDHLQSSTCFMVWVGGTVCGGARALHIWRSPVNQSMRTLLKHFCRCGLSFCDALFFCQLCLEATAARANNQLLLFNPKNDRTKRLLKNFAAKNINCVTSHVTSTLFFPQKARKCYFLDSKTKSQKHQCIIPSLITSSSTPSSQLSWNY